ncbi:MAG TPA: hypothetical protein VGM69_10170 [Chloroflexota bacterium]
MSAPRPGVVFRAAAVERYQARRAAAGASWLRLPRAPLALWLLVALLLTGVVAAWVARVPVYVTGVAVVLEPAAAEPGERADVFVAALLPGESLASLRPGQPLYLQLGADGQRLRRTVAAVDPEVVSPDALPARLGLGSLNRGVVMLLGGPVVVARAALEPLPPPFAASAYVGSVLPVKVEVGRRRVVALIPPFDRLLGE